MISILDLYIARIIVQQTLLAFAVLLGLFVFVTFIDQLGDLGVNDFGITDAIRYVVLTIPRTIYELFPMAALLGSMLGLSILANDSELTVMRASGMSVFQIAAAALKIGVLFALVAVLLGEFVTPTTETMAQRGRAEALQRHIKQQTDFGLWMKDNRTFVNVGEVLPDLTLLRLRIIEFDENDRLRGFAYAKKGEFDTPYESQGWRLLDVRQTLVDEEGSARPQLVDAAVWETQVSPDILSVFLIKPDQLSIWQLNQYIGHLNTNSQDTRRYKLAFWSKLFLPLSTAVMVILAIPFVFQQIRSGGPGRNLFIGIMLGVAFYVVDKGFGNIVQVYNIPPFLGALIPVAAFSALAVLMFRRV
jgi:lipopolysaccharide export system permease protein